MMRIHRVRATAGVLTNRWREVNRVAVPQAFVFLLLVSASLALAQDEPKLTTDVVNFEKLLPVLPEPPAGWTSEKPEGSTTDAGNARITTVHRDYKKGDADNAPTTSISIIDAAANPEMAEAMQATWSVSQTSTEGYAKSFKAGDDPGFESYEKDHKHGSLYVLIAKRYLLQIEMYGQDSKELQEWLKRVDLKKLAAVK